MITSNVAFYPCVKLEDTEKFYTQVIGLKVASRQPNVVILSTGQGHFGFVAYGEREVATKHLCLSLNCESDADVMAEYERILRAGGKPETEPKKHPTHPVFSFFIKDPSGYTVEFQKIIDADL